MNEMVWKQEYQVENTAYAMTAIIQDIPSFYLFSSCLTWKIFVILQVLMMGLSHFITPSLLPSLPVRHLETRGEFPREKARNARRKI